MSQLRMAIIGGGYLGTIHTQLALSQPEVELVAVVDPDPEARRRLATIGVPTVEDAENCISQVDAAIIACPTRFHYTVAKKFLSAGVHVFVEKPFTTTVAEADALMELANQRQLVVQVGHVERFNPAFTAARPFLTDVCFLHATRTSGHACRSTDIGAVLDLMIHDLDLVLHLVDSPLQEVQASGTVVVGPYEDTAEARLQFANGVVAVLAASRVSRQACRRMQVVTRHGLIDIDFAERKCWREVPVPEQVGQFQPEQWSPQEREAAKQAFFDRFVTRQSITVVEYNALMAEQRDFVSAVQSGRQPLVTALSARQTLVVAERIQQEIVRFTQRVRLRTPPHVLPLVEPTTAALRRKAG